MRLIAAAALAFFSFSPSNSRISRAGGSKLVIYERRAANTVTSEPLTSRRRPLRAHAVSLVKYRFFARRSSALRGRVGESKIRNALQATIEMWTASLVDRS